ncbi:MAG: winged helix-turn-helix domain-containing protein [Thermoprotei archaeon]
MSAKTLTAKIMLFLYENPGASLKDISQYIGISVNTARTIIYRLRNNGFVDRAGNGYVLTSKGEWFVSNILLKKEESEKPETEESREEVQAALESESSGASSEYIETASVEVEHKRAEQGDLRGLLDRVRKLENEVRKLYELLDKAMSEIKEIKEELARQQRRETSEKPIEGLPKPVMNIKEAMDQLGPVFEELRLSGRIEIVGNLVVDRNFYEEFKKKFPIPVSEADKLPPMEKMLLQEMIRDARVIVRAGREYRLA